MRAGTRNSFPKGLKSSAMTEHSKCFDHTLPNSQYNSEVPRKRCCYWVGTKIFPKVIHYGRNSGIFIATLATKKQY